MLMVGVVWILVVKEVGEGVLLMELVDLLCEVVEVMVRKLMCMGDVWFVFLWLLVEWSENELVVWLWLCVVLELGLMDEFVCV